MLQETVTLTGSQTVSACEAALPRFGMMALTDAAVMIGSKAAP
jgi:hypothetical protein